MKTFWKVVLIVLGVLLVLGMIAVPLAARLFAFGGRPMMYYAPYYGHHMGGWGGFGFFGGGMGMLMMFVPLLLGVVVIGLVVYGLVALVKNHSGSAQQTHPSAPAPAAQSVVEPVSEPKPVSAALTCKNCGKPLEPEWVVCPYCGEKVDK